MNFKWDGSLVFNRVIMIGSKTENVANWRRHNYLLNNMQIIFTLLHFYSPQQLSHKKASENMKCCLKNITSQKIFSWCLWNAKFERKCKTGSMKSTKLKIASGIGLSMCG